MTEPSVKRPGLDDRLKSIKAAQAGLLIFGASTFLTLTGWVLNAGGPYWTQLSYNVKDETEVIRSGIELLKPYDLTVADATTMARSREQLEIVKLKAELFEKKLEFLQKQGLYSSSHTQAIGLMAGNTLFWIGYIAVVFLAASSNLEAEQIKAGYALRLEACDADSQLKTLLETAQEQDLAMSVRWTKVVRATAGLIGVAGILVGLASALT